MKYPFWCEHCQTELLVEAPMKSGPITPFCPCGKGLMQRIWIAPVIHTPETNAADILQRHYDGRGDPAPGMSQAKTVATARAMHQNIKKMKGQKPDSGPTISTPAMPGAHKYYGPD